MKQDKQVQCQICGKLFKSMSRHLSDNHKIPFNVYFVKYILPSAPKCKNKDCKKPAVFCSLHKGFRKYCSISCSQQKELNNLWKGGRRINNGYVLIRCESHPRASKDGKYRYEHDLVMESNLGRYLRKGEVVHHKNGIRSDNRLENLNLTTNSKHIASHNKFRVWTKESKRKESIRAQNRHRDNSGRFVEDRRD